MQPFLPEILKIASLMAEGQFERALELAKACLEGDPSNAELCNLAGLCSNSMGNLELAEAFWSRALAMNPEALEPCFNLGLLLLKRNADEEAERCFRQVLQFSPENAAACANLALLLERAGRAEEAEQFHYRAVSLAGESAEIRFNLANFLAAEEAVERAKSAFIDVIRIMPTHFGAWINLGNLLFETGFTQAAHTAYSAAVSHYPEETSARVNLGNVLLHMDEPESAEKQFSAALAIDPELAEAHQGLASAFHRQGDMERAAHHRKKGFGGNPVSHLPYRGRKEAVPLLVLASSLEGNVPWRFLIDPHLFRVTIVAVECFNQAELPENRLIFNAIGDADLCREGLEIAANLVAKTDSPVINPPEKVLKTGRIGTAERFSHWPGVVTPDIFLLSRGQELKQFPVLLRSPGFHGGNYFVKADDDEALQRALETLPGDRLLAMNFLDSRSEDGLFRKFRVMSINGNLYPIHLAVSGQWKVHYFSSDMAENEAHRREEEAFLSDFQSFLGRDAVSALGRIGDTLGLDYCGMDFGVGRDGSILLFEANATMALILPGSERQWDYKRSAATNALEAARKMFAGMIDSSGRL